MEKDPAFLFYSKDWLQGTAKLMPDEKGVYIDLIAHQHQDKFLPNDTKRLSRIVGMSESDFLPIWEVLKEKFIVVNSTQLVNKKLSKIMGERSEKGIKNKIIGTLASVFRLSTEPYEKKVEAKKTFKYEDFLTVSDQRLTESITEWFDCRLKSIGNGNENANINNKEVLPNLWFLKFYHSSYENYKAVYNGQSTTEQYFLEWKKFIDFIYEKKFEELFECKFLSPHDFAKLVQKENFTKDKWEQPLKMILSTGVKPEHNLFFRIPEFINYANKSSSKSTPKNRHTVGAENLLAEAKQFFESIGGNKNT